MTVELRYKGEDKKYEVGGIIAENDNEAGKIAIDCMARNLYINSKQVVSFDTIKSNLTVFAVK